MMENSDYIETFQNLVAKCDKCGSKDLLLFTETRVKNCVAWACYSCESFEIRAKPDTLKEFFAKEHDKQRLS